MAYIDDPQTQKANTAYIKTAMNEPMLERGHEFELARSWRDKGDKKALHELVSSYTRLVVAMASKYRNYGLPLGDLIQEGNIGLMQAAERFDPERDIRFSTYASWWIRAAIQDYVLRNWSIVRTGTTAAQKSLFFNLRRLRAQIEKSGHALDGKGRQTIANDLGVKVRDVETMEQRLSAGDSSLNAPLTNGSQEEWQNFLADERPSPEDVVIGMKDGEARSEWLNKALGALSDRERKIISERHLKDEVVTLETLGTALGISKERVRQIEAGALNKLKTSIGAMVKDKRDLFLEG